MASDMAQERLARSPDLADRGASALVVIDLQERLLPVQPDGARVVWNSRRLVDGAAALGVPATLTEQVPEKLGPTVAVLRERLPSPMAKSEFSAAGCGGLVEGWRSVGVRAVTLVGVETHVCVAQTAIDLVAEGFSVRVAVDAVGSRFAIDHEVALRRLEASGVLLTTVEAQLFEWCVSAADPAFRAISALAKESPPAT